LPFPQEVVAGNVPGGVHLYVEAVMNPPEKTVGRNDPCPCGSGRKYKHCCLAKDEAALRDARAKEAKKAAKAEAKPNPAEEETREEAHGAPRDARAGHHQPPGSRPDQPWKRSAGNTHPSQRKGMHRKIGSK
jgi:hypothetical protein